jgi:hypothetical protein
MKGNGSKNASKCARDLGINGRTFSGIHLPEELENFNHSEGMDERPRLFVLCSVVPWM